MKTRLGGIPALLVLPLFVGLVADADAPASREITVLDPRNGSSLTIETEAAALDAGHFVFRVPGLGQYVGDAGDAMRVVSHRSVIVHFRGSASLRPAVSTDGTIVGSVRSPISIEIELQAQIDPAHRTGEAMLRDADQRHHLVAPAIGRADLEPTLRAMESAFIADDPLALYQLANGDLRAAYTPAAFAVKWHAQASSIGRVTAMRARNVSEPETNDLGFVFVTVTYEVERQTPAGTFEATLFDVLFVREADAWRLLLSRVR